MRPFYRVLLAVLQKAFKPREFYHRARVFCHRRNRGPSLLLGNPNSGHLFESVTSAFHPIRQSHQPSRAAYHCRTFSAVAVFVSASAIYQFASLGPFTIVRCSITGRRGQFILGTTDYASVVSHLRNSIVIMSIATLSSVILNCRSHVRR